MFAGCHRSARHLVLTLVVLFCLLVLSACALFKSTAKTVIDVALIACMEKHPEIVEPEAMRKVCPFVEDVGPIVADLLAARKQGLARVASEDAGAKDASK